MSEEVFTQMEHEVELTTPDLGGTVLLISFDGTEALGRLFQYELNIALVGKTPLDFKKLLGQNVTVRLDTSGDASHPVRYFNGYVSRIVNTGMRPTQTGDTAYTYRVSVVPWTWFLTRSADCRIFQEKTVPEIIEALFRERGFTDFDPQLTGTYRKWEYCVQYRETDFNFVSRLMENEGIYYFFKHENGKHTLVLCDASSAHTAAEGYDPFQLRESNFVGIKDDAFLWNATSGTEITANEYALNDFNPLQPSTSLLKNVSFKHDHDPGAYELFDYPGGYTTVDEGKEYSRIRAEETEVSYIVLHAATSARRLLVGSTFDYEATAGWNYIAENTYLVTSCSFHIEGPSMGLATAANPIPYAAQITAIPSKTPFRTTRTTPKPVVQGPQTAIVVTSGSEEITCDKYGRVKVKFHWDRTDVMNEKASCWIRVSQPVAGKKWGAISIPRKGQEVIVEFLEGDPDRPIITGRVYHGENLPPYELPANATMTAFKSNASPGGDGFNEFRIEDKKGEEQIFIHAEKNYDLRVKNDRFENVANNQHMTVDNSMYVKVASDHNLTVNGNSMAQVDGDSHEKIGGQEAKEIGGTKCLKVGGDVVEEFGANQSTLVSSSLFIKATDIIIEGTSSITIKVGGTSIAIDSGGIKCVATATIDTQSGAATKLEAGATMDVKSAAPMKLNSGATLDAIGAGPVKVTGAVVQVNS